MTAELINGITGFHIWSETYDRNVGDVLRLQTEIASTVAETLKVTLLGDIAAKIELGGTRNPAAFDAYLRGSKIAHEAQELNDDNTAIAYYTQAIRQDPNYALAFVSRSFEYNYATDYETGAAVRESFDKARQDALKAISLAPELAEAHFVLAYYFEFGRLDFAHASEEYDRALALAPRNAIILLHYAEFAAAMGRKEASVAAARNAVLLDPLNRSAHLSLGEVLYWGREYNEAVTAYQNARAIDDDFAPIYPSRGLAQYALGALQSAKTSCERYPDYTPSRECLAMIYDKLGRHAEAEAQLAKAMASQGETDTYQYVCVYAQWGDVSKALEWLEAARRRRDLNLIDIKVDPLLDPLRREPAFQDVIRQLNFPN